VSAGWRRATNEANLHGSFTFVAGLWQAGTLGTNQSQSPTIGEWKLGSWGHPHFRGSWGEVGAIHISGEVGAIHISGDQRVDSPFRYKKWVALSVHISRGPEG
jgi:hypothetical protein